MLRGLRILNARPQGAGQRALTEALHQVGADVTEVPMLKLTPVPVNELQRQRLGEAHGIIVVSPSCVEALDMACVKSLINSQAQLIAVGPGTQKALLERGVTHVLCSKNIGSAGVLAMAEMQEAVIAEQNWCVLCAKEGAKPLVETLSHRKAQVLSIAVMQRHPYESADENLIHQWQNLSFDVTVVTSFQSLLSLECALANYAKAAFAHTVLTAVNTQMTNRAKRWGGPNTIVLEDLGAEAICRAIIAWREHYGQSQ